MVGVGGVGGGRGVLGVGEVRGGVGGREGVYLVSCRGSDGRWSPRDHYGGFWLVDPNCEERCQGRRLHRASGSTGRGGEG